MMEHKWLLELSKDQLKVCTNICEYINEFEYKPDRWDVINFLIGYKGWVASDDIKVIMLLVREGYLNA